MNVAGIDSGTVKKNGKIKRRGVKKVIVKLRRHPGTRRKGIRLKINKVSVEIGISGIAGHTRLRDGVKLRVNQPSSDMEKKERGIFWER